jgi:hypothetical protein
MLTFTELVGGAKRGGTLPTCKVQRGSAPRAHFNGMHPQNVLRRLGLRKKLLSNIEKRVEKDQDGGATCRLIPSKI